MPRTATPRPTVFSRFTPFSCISSDRRSASIFVVSSAGARTGSGISSENSTVPSSRTADRTACRRLIRMPRPQAASLLMSTRISRLPAAPLVMLSPSESSPSLIISPTILVIAAGVRFMLSASRLRDMAPCSCRMRSAALRFARLTVIKLSPL